MTNHAVFATRSLLFAAFSAVWIAVQMPMLTSLFTRKLGLVFFPALLVVSLFRYMRAGSKEVTRELTTVAKDLSFPAWYLMFTYKTTETLSTADWTFDLLDRLAILSKYTFMYGPVSFGGALLIAAPFAIPLQPMMREEWFLKHAGQWFAIVLVSMIFFGVASNACNHRFFSHGSFKASRVTTFFLGTMGCLGGQFGPLWWASNHRRHHKFCETDKDVHSPSVHGFWYSHMGWIMDADNFPIRPEYVPPCGKKYPELMLLDIFCTNILFLFLYCSSRMIKDLISLPEESNTPGFIFHLIIATRKEDVPLWHLDFSGLFVDTALILGFSLSLHFEFLTNSWCHTWEKKEKTDNSPCKGLDCYWAGILNGGEGFHKNHHQFPVAAQHGPHWYYDASYTFICVLESFGLVWDVEPKKH